MKTIIILLFGFLLALSGINDNFAIAAVVAPRDSEISANVNAVPPNGLFLGGIQCRKTFVDPTVCGNAETAGGSSYVSDELCNEICQCNVDSVFLLGNCQSYGSCSGSKVYQLCTKNGCGCLAPSIGARERVQTHVPGELMMII